jgi:hypothetical protein
MHAAERTVAEGPCLESLLSYENEDVIDSFCDSLNVERDEASMIFKEMLKFLWLCHIENDRSLKTIDSPIIIIDEMWHTFILFTREYHAFSIKYFGSYAHHAPTTAAEKSAARLQNPETRHQQLLTEQRQRYTKIYEHLGRETFIRWFYYFPEKYPLATIRQLRKK